MTTLNAASGCVASYYIENTQRLQNKKIDIKSNEMKDVFDVL